MILHQTQIVSAALLRRNWPSHFVALVCVEGGLHLLLCTPELLSVGVILLRMRDQREESFMFLLFLSINICCGLKRYLFQYEESGRRTFFGWGKKLPLEGTVEGPWAVWTDCYYQREWMLFVCLCMYATQQALLWRQPSQIFFWFLLITPSPHNLAGLHYTRSFISPRLRAGPKHYN